MARLGWRWSALLALALALGACVGAERAPRSNGMGRLSEVDIQALGLRQVEGRVKSVDPETGVITIERAGDEEVNILTDPSTTIYIAGAMAALADLEEGAPIRASFENDGPKNLARWVEIPRDEEPPPPPPDPPAAPPGEATPAPERPAVNAPPGGAAP